jgi:hypothetical protein
MNCACGDIISSERSALGFKVCLTCGERFAQASRKFGYQHYGHKTAGSIVIGSKSIVDNYLKVSQRKGKACNLGYASRIGTMMVGN